MVNQRKNHAPRLRLSKEWFEEEVFSVFNKRKCSGKLAPHPFSARAGKLNYDVFHLDLRSLKTTLKTDLQSTKQVQLGGFIESLYFLWFFCRNEPSQPYKSSLLIETDP